MIGLVQVGMQAMADRYAYLPFIGLFIMIMLDGGRLVREADGCLNGSWQGLVS